MKVENQPQAVRPASKGSGLKAVRFRLRETPRKPTEVFGRTNRLGLIQPAPFIRFTSRTGYLREQLVSPNGNGEECCSFVLSEFALA